METRSLPEDLSITSHSREVGHRGNNIQTIIGGMLLALSPLLGQNVTYADTAQSNTSKRIQEQRYLMLELIENIACALGCAGPLEHEESVRPRIASGMPVQSELIPSPEIDGVLRSEAEWLNSPLLHRKIQDIENMSRAFNQAKTPRHMKQRVETFLRSLIIEMGNPLPAPLRERIDQPDINKDFQEYVEENIMGLEYLYPPTLPPSERPVRSDVILRYMTELFPLLETEDHVLTELEATAFHPESSNRHTWHILQKICEHHGIILKPDEDTWPRTNIPHRIYIQMQNPKNEKDIRYSSIEGGFAIYSTRAVMQFKQPHYRFPIPLGIQWKRECTTLPLEKWRREFQWMLQER